MWTILKVAPSDISIMFPQKETFQGEQVNSESGSCNSALRGGGLSDRNEGLSRTLEGPRYSKINSTKSQSLGAITLDHRLMSQLVRSARSRVRVGQCVSATIAVEVPVFVCLHSSCSRVTEYVFIPYASHEKTQGE